MVALTIKHSVQWQAPLPIWAENSSTGIRVHNEDQAAHPSIFRFATDTFMEDMLGVMNTSPKRISEWLAQPETWREPAPTPEPAPKKAAEGSISFLFNKTKQLADQHKPAQKKIVSTPKQAVVVSQQARIEGAPIKLFQSTHQRFYLVSASLICGCAGFPDQLIDRTKQEKASFVIRRLVPPPSPDKIPDDEPVDNRGDWDEYAFVGTSNGPRWMKIGQSKNLACKKLFDLEEQLPLFPMSYKDNCRHDRRLLNGLIPVGQREKWMSAPIADAYSSAVADATGVDFNAAMSRAQVIFQTDVTEPWKALVEHGENKKNGLSRNFDNFETSGSSTAETDRARRTLRDNIQMASWYVLLDFAKFLEKRLPGVWSVAQQLVENSSLRARDFELTDNEIELLNTIKRIRLSRNIVRSLVELEDQYLGPVPPGNSRRLEALAAGTVKKNLLAALVAIRPLEAKLETVETEFVRFDEDPEPPEPPEPHIVPLELDIDDKWPRFLFPLADPEYIGPTPNSHLRPNELEDRLLRIDELAELIGEILPEPDETGDFINPATSLDQRDAWFVVRCVYERPNCGPLFPPLVSDPTRMLQMAPFFDPDAPARPIRIPMPVDISPAGLRKYKKNTAFVISDMLCGKIKKIRKMSLGDLVLSVLPWPFHKDLPDPGDTGPCTGANGFGFGMICSLSIPIVTLCALILLMIMVALFDLFFRWIPFLFLCLPIPGLKGK